MNRLLYVMPFTPDIEGMKRFYRDAIGLEVRSESPFFVDFESGGEGAALALLAVQPQQKREIELCFESNDVEADYENLRSRGAEFTDAPRKQEFGTVVHLRDPDGHSLSLLKPAPGIGIARASGTRADAEWRAGVAGAPVAVRTSPTALATAVENPRFSMPILFCRDMTVAKAFYRDKLGLRLQADFPSWVVFEAGASSLALHPLGESQQQSGRTIELGFTVGDLMGWADEARDRGLHFETAPTDRGWGLAADASDPEGNELTFREPAPPPALEEELAEAFEDDATPQHSAIRKPVKKGARAVSHVALKPDYKAAPDTRPKKAARTAAAKRKGKRMPSVRGAGPERTRLTPKNLDDPQRPNLRQGVGRLKKAERRTLARKKTAVANASKSKPIKRAAASRGKARGRSR